MFGAVSCHLPPLTIYQNYLLPSHSLSGSGDVGCSSLVVVVSSRGSGLIGYTDVVVVGDNGIDDDMVGSGDDEVVSYFAINISIHYTESYIKPSNTWGVANGEAAGAVLAAGVFMENGDCYYVKLRMEVVEIV